MVRPPQASIMKGRVGVQVTQQVEDGLALGSLPSRSTPPMLFWTQ
jgi:hypothetical protein